MSMKRLLLSALWAALMFAAGLVVPLLGQLAALFSPVPLIMAYALAGRNRGMLALAVSGLLVMVFTGWQSAVIFLLSFGLMAAGAAEGMLRRFRPENAVLLAGLVPAALLGLALAAAFAKGGVNPVTALEGYLRSSVDEAVKLYTALGLNEAAAAVQAVSESFIYYLVRLTPSLAVATAVVQAACCYGIAKVLLRKNAEAAAFLPATTLASWHAPDTWVWGLIAALGLSAVPWHGAAVAGWNLGVLCGVLYTAQGMAVLEHYFKKAALPAFGRGVLLAFILAMPSLFLVAALGVVDVWADFRKVRTIEKKA